MTDDPGAPAERSTWKQPPKANRTGVPAHVILRQAAHHLVRGEQTALEAVLHDPFEVVLVDVGRDVDDRPKGGRAGDPVNRGEVLRWHVVVVNDHLLAAEQHAPHGVALARTLHVGEAIASVVTPSARRPPARHAGTTIELGSIERLCVWLRT